MSSDEIRNVQARRKIILYLIRRYLQDNGYYNTVTTLNTDAKLTEDFELCDNIDLDAMYLEYASYYQLKFGKYPRFLKKSTQQPVLKVEMAAGGAKKKQLDKNSKQSQQASKEENPTGKKLDGKDLGFADLQISVTKMETNAVQAQPQTDTATMESRLPANIETLTTLQEIQHSCNMAADDILLNSPDWQNLAELVKSTILTDDSKMKWSDICGNSKAMDVIIEAVITPIKYPQLFAYGLKPWKSVLLHGPPGSGKTLLARVLYAETKGQVTFFNITSSIIVSKWRGESEKLIKILFHLAQKHAPSIIFLDEIEGLTSKRDRTSDHESSKRFKNELLQLMDGMEQGNVGVFILASTNLPWEIDDAFLRRFEKKLLVQLPNEQERTALIRKLLPANMKITPQQLTQLVKASLHFTGDEIRLGCKEIAMQSVRRITKATNRNLKESDLLEMPLETAFLQIKPLSLGIMERHVQWQKTHGS